jgi:hypothetical protein
LYGVGLVKVGRNAEMSLHNGQQITSFAKAMLSICSQINLHSFRKSITVGIMTIISMVRHVNYSRINFTPTKVKVCMHMLRLTTLGGDGHTLGRYAKISANFE